MTSLATEESSIGSKDARKSRSSRGIRDPRAQKGLLQNKGKETKKKIDLINGNFFFKETRTYTDGDPTRVSLSTVLRSESGARGTGVRKR